MPCLLLLQRCCHAAQMSMPLRATICFIAVDTSADLRATPDRLVDAYDAG